MLKFLFDKGKGSWLSTKYVPELNTYGEIDKYISAFLGRENQRKTIGKTFQSLCCICNDFFHAADELIAVCGDKDQQLLNLLTVVNIQLTALKPEAEKALIWLNNETVFGVDINESAFYIDIENLNQHLKESKEEYYHHFHFYEVSKALRKLESIDTRNALRFIQSASDKTSITFLGEPGTGKTHGVAAETEKLFDEGYHVPILIQARDVPIDYAWKDIISTNLGLSSGWSEEEIWQALSSLSSTLSQK